MKYFFNLLLSLIIVCFSLFFLTRHLDKPFWGHHDWNSSIWTLTAKNNLNHGIFCTKLGQSTTYQPISDCRSLRYYQNHPPLISWLLTASYLIFNLDEWAGRLPIILISTGSVLLIFLIGKSLFSKWVGFLAGLLAVATPMFRYFGKSINHEPLVLFSTLLGTYSFIRWYKGNKQNSWYLIFLLSALLTGLSGWHGYLLYPILITLTFFYDKNRTKKSLWALVILIGTFLAHQAHTALLSGKPDLSLFSQLLVRIGLGTSDSVQAQITQFSYPKFFIQEARWMTIYFTRILVVGSIVYLLLKVKSIVSIKKVSFSTSVIFSLLVFGLSIPFIFNQQAFIHDYLNIYLLPFLALATALVFKSLSRIFPKPIIITLAALILAGVCLERQSYLAVLQESHANQSYVELAKLIKQKQVANEQDKFLIEAANFYNFAYPFLWNYAYPAFIDSRTDDLPSFKKDQKALEGQYDYLITVETNPVEEELIKFLEVNYEKEKIDKFTFYRF